MALFPRIVRFQQSMTTAMDSQVNTGASLWWPTLHAVRLLRACAAKKRAGHGCFEFDIRRAARPRIQLLNSGQIVGRPSSRKAYSFGPSCNAELWFQGVGLLGGLYGGLEESCTVYPGIFFCGAAGKTAGKKTAANQPVPEGLRKRCHRPAWEISSLRDALLRLIRQGAYDARDVHPYALKARRLIALYGCLTHCRSGRQLMNTGLHVRQQTGPILRYCICKCLIAESEPGTRIPLEFSGAPRQAACDAAPAAKRVERVPTGTLSRSPVVRSTDAMQVRCPSCLR